MVILALFQRLQLYSTRKQLHTVDTTHLSNITEHRQTCCGMSVDMSVSAALYSNKTCNEQQSKRN